ncbi:hypothetical protein [Phytomonospora endophytica]|uniref:Putative membrane protein n=1 Tax=Phytomonospora endophytica TaxID=714109 RepID=A0A841FRJ4_9ACTN|nr:hypothetical protein [Phytomonospora endophytica]MBB6039911.1 putative membrane protein [Phytomonospora endophytica]GIG71019.1 hypothetical protein Pen01_73140 [Phytomonospora endophytica]
MRSLRMAAATLAAAATLSACAVTGDRTPVPDPEGAGGGEPAPMAAAFLLDLAAVDASLAADEDAIPAAQELCLRIADGADEDAQLDDVEELFTDIEPADRELILASAKENIC